MRTRWQFFDWAQFALGGTNIVLGALFLFDSPNAFLTLIIGALLCLLPVWRRHAYNHGWISGRARMVSALYESAQRGHSLDDWLRAEVERDIAALPPAVLKKLQQP